MAKRLYVAIGSVGVRSLMELVRRYQDEGFYRDTQDMFVGMDTAHELVSRLRGLDKDNRHIEAIHIVHEDTDSSVRDLVGFFRNKWDKNALIPMTGVGGDRTLSFSTLKWTQNVEFQRRVESLGKGDELILIGTAFGGTSTGMFWNVAMWLRANLRRDENQHCAEFYSFLVLPGDQGGDLAKYPWSYNLCAFMKDMQSLEFSQRIQRQMQAKVPYRMPLFALYNPAEGKELLPVWSKEHFGSSDHCFLPFDRLVLVPTPESGVGSEAHVPHIVAEQAFVLGALNGWQDFRVTAQTIDLMTTAHGNDYRKPDYAFAGFNMVAGRSARRVALSAVFWKAYREQYKQFIASGVKTGSAKALSDLLSKARSHLRASEHVIPLVESHRSRFIQTLDDRRLSASETAGQLGTVCKEVQETLRPQPYAWVSFTDFVRLCADWIQPILIMDPDTFITLDDLHGLYLTLRNEFQREVNQLEDVRVRLLDLPTRWRQIVRTRSGKIATKALGAKDAVEMEVRTEYRRAELEYFNWFVDCCRADATKNQFALDADIVAEFRSIVQGYEQRLKPMLDAASLQIKQTSLPACIYEDNSVPTDVSGSLSVTRGRYLQLMLNGAGASESEIQGDADVVERQTVADLGEQASALGPANPLKKIALDFSKGPAPKAFSDVFRVNDVNEWHCHFILQHGSVAPFTWGKLTTFSSAFETFSRLLPPGTPFSEGQNVDARGLAGQHYFAESVQNGESQGGWVGTLQLDAEIRTTIRNTYEKVGKPIHVWQQRAFSAVAEGAPQRSLLTLPETLAFGLILGGIDECTKHEKSLGARGCEVRCDRAGLTLSIKPNDVSLYFKHVSKPEREYLMVNINTSWITPLMAWIDGTFWVDTGMEDFKKRLIELERGILEKMTLSFGEDEFHKPLLALAATVKDLLHVNLC